MDRTAGAAMRKACAAMIVLGGIMLIVGAVVTRSTMQWIAQEEAFGIGLLAFVTGLLLLIGFSLRTGD